MSRGGSYAAAPAIAALLCAICGCGAARHDPPAARVGTTTISTASVAHWMIVLAPRHVLPSTPGTRERLRRQALEFLISSAWLDGEAAREGDPITRAQVSAAVARRERALGHDEFANSLAATGHTLADYELEMERGLAAAAIAQRVRAGAGTPSGAQVSRYYRENVDRFAHAERRYFYIVEAIPSAAQARALIGAFADGRRDIASSGTSLHEHFDRPRDMRRARTILKALFTARPRTIVGPIDVNGQFFIVYVTHVRPAYTLALAQVRTRIAAKLTLARRSAALARFVDSWRGRWIAATSCAPGYVVQQCRQYRGVRSAEPDQLDGA